MAKLSDGQREALQKLATVGEWACSYSLRAGLNTLHSLERRKLAAVRYDRGSMFSPQTAIKFRITEAGRAALSPPPPSAGAFHEETEG